ETTAVLSTLKSFGDGHSAVLINPLFPSTFLFSSSAAKGMKGHSNLIQASKTALRVCCLGFNFFPERLRYHLTSFQTSRRATVSARLTFISSSAAVTSLILVFITAKSQSSRRSGFLLSESPMLRSMKGK